MRFVSLTSGSLQIGGVHQLVFMARAKFTTETALCVDQNWSPTLIVSPCIAVFACFRMYPSSCPPMSICLHIKATKCGTQCKGCTIVFWCLLNSFVVSCIPVWLQCDDFFAYILYTYYWDSGEQVVIRVSMRWKLVIVIAVPLHLETCAELDMTSPAYVCSQAGLSESQISNMRWADKIHSEKQYSI